MMAICYPPFAPDPPDGNQMQLFRDAVKRATDDAIWGQLDVRGDDATIKLRLVPAHSRRPADSPAPPTPAPWTRWTLAKVRRWLDQHFGYTIKPTYGGLWICADKNCFQYFTAESPEEAVRLAAEDYAKRNPQEKS